MGGRLVFRYAQRSEEQGSGLEVYQIFAGKEGSLLWGGRAASKFDLTCIPEVNTQLGLD
jgi:hypothetical protein